MFTKSNAEDECGIAGAVRSVRCGAVNEGRKLVDRNHANEAPWCHDILCKKRKRKKRKKEKRKRIKKDPEQSACNAGYVSNA